MAEKPGIFRRLLASAATAAARAIVVKEFTPKDPNAAALVMGVENDTGQLVTAETAMTLSAVWACVRLIAESIAMMPLHLFHADDDKHRIAYRHPVNALLSMAPNSKTTATVFWEGVVSAMLLQGNAYVLRKYSRDRSRLVSLVFLAPSRLVVTTDMYSQKQFQYRFDDGVTRKVAASDVWQLQGYTLDGRDGVSVIEYARQVFGSALAAEKSAARTFRNGMLQAVYYTVNAFLTDEQRNDFRKNVRGTVERGEAPVLEGGVDVKSLGIKPQDAQLLQSRSFSVEEVCRWFRVPPHMVGHSEKSTSWGTGLEAQTLAFLTFTLQPWINRIQQGIALGLLSPVDRERYRAEFDTEVLLKMDSTALANYLGTMVNKGLMYPNEARRKAGLPRDEHPNSDKLLVQGAMVMLDSLTSTPKDGTSNPAQPLEEAAAALQAAIRSIHGGKHP